MRKICLAIVIGIGLVACGKPAQTLSSNQIGQEVESQKAFKSQLSQMTPAQRAQLFKSDPRRARAMLMPPGMGNPALRLQH